MAATQRSRVLLLIPHLGGGGAERVTALLARGLSRDKYEIHLGVVTQSAGAPELEALGVQVHALGAKRVRNGAGKLLRLVRRLEPDLILSGMAHLNFLVLMLRPFFPRKIRVLVRQNGMASAALAFGGLPVYTRLLYRLLYPRANCVICQTAAMAKDMKERFRVPAARLAVLPNPVDVKAIRERVTAVETRSGTGRRLLAIGRLSREKGFDLLLDALAGVRCRFPDVELTIAGVGAEENALKTQCDAPGLREAVRFAGYVDDTAVLFAEASVFVLSSRHEGLPNALLEAAAAGVPIVALPSSQGVVDLVRGQPGVWLAHEISAAALERSLLAALAELQPGERFEHRFVEEFGLEHSIAKYETLIDKALNEGTL